MKTFNIDLWQTLKLPNEDEEKFLDGHIYFGEAPEDVPAPYCVIHVLDCGEDENSLTLCGNETGIGISDIQFNLYSTNDMQLDELLQELNLKIKSLKNLSDYRIINAIRGTTKNASGFSSEVGMGFTRFNFRYELL